jgi:serine protease AprX
LNDQIDVRSVAGPDPATRHTRILQELQRRAAARQQGILAFLARKHSEGTVGDVTPFWIFNGVMVDATADVIRELASRSDVLRITPNRVVHEAPTPAAAAEPEANLSIVHAPEVWNLGFQGQGVVVATMDSGVDITNADLAARWRGGSHSWYDPSGQHPTSPIDLTGHGTGTMGIILGGSAGGTAIGIAPAAQWIAVKIFDDRGVATAAKIHLGYQWLLNPNGDPTNPGSPQVVNNSWSLGTPGCDLEFQADLQALRALDIVPVFAAGNFGPETATGPSPANYPEALSVGATNNLDQISSLSSLGPSTCGSTSRIYPNVVAPGVSIRTADLFGGYQVATGTSLSAPHVSGALALLLSAFPHLTADSQQAAVMNNAVDLGTAGPDNTYGYGRLDVLAAYNSLAALSLTPLPTMTQTSTSTQSPTALPSTSTPTPTPSSTVTASPTASATASQTTTSTITPTATRTIRPTRTRTAIRQATRTRRPLPLVSDTSGVTPNSTVDDVVPIDITAE